MCVSVCAMAAKALKRASWRKQSLPVKGPPPHAPHPFMKHLATASLQPQEWLPKQPAMPPPDRVLPQQPVCEPHQPAGPPPLHLQLQASHLVVPERLTARTETCGSFQMPGVPKKAGLWHVPKVVAPPPRVSSIPLPPSPPSRSSAKRQRLDAEDGDDDDALRFVFHNMLSQQHEPDTADEPELDVAPADCVYDPYGRNESAC